MRPAGGRTVAITAATNDEVDRINRAIQHTPVSPDFDGLFAFVLVSEGVVEGCFPYMAMS